MSAKNTIQDRREFCEKNIQRLRESVAKISVLQQTEVEQLCIYATGSYARKEASKYSDLDLFIVHMGSKEKNGISNIQATLLFAEVIRIVRSMDMPEFSNDGEFLKIHYLEDILRDLGGQEDDYKNYFTARLLLLLESAPIFNDKVYKAILNGTITSYYRDYHEHEKDFRPIFLVNDIIRYWKTLCLNYEHRRNRPANNAVAKNKQHIKNLKLKFSRMLTCYSVIIPISRLKGSVSLSDVRDIVLLTPLERLSRLTSELPNTKSLFVKIEDLYGWFLDATGHPEEEMLTWIEDKRNRNHAFDQARDFGKSMYKLLKVSVGDDDSETMRYLVI